MQYRIIAIAASAFMLLGAVTSAGAQGTTQQPSQPQPPASQGGPGMMGPRCDIADLAGGPAGGR